MVGKDISLRADGQGALLGLYGFHPRFTEHSRRFPPRFFAFSRDTDGLWYSNRRHFDGAPAKDGRIDP